MCSHVYLLPAGTLFTALVPPSLAGKLRQFSTQPSDQEEDGEGDVTDGDGGAGGILAAWDGAEGDVGGSQQSGGWGVGDGDGAWGTWEEGGVKVAGR